MQENISELWAHQAVDDEVDGGVEDGQVPGNEVHQELVGWGKVVAASLVTPHYWGDSRVHRRIIKSVNNKEEIITEQPQRSQ